MKCAKVKKELELMFEGVKPGAETFSHIKDCKKCRAEYETMLQITGVFLNTEDVKVPSGFNKGVWDRIGEPAPGILNGIFRPAFVLGGAAAAALVLFMVFFAKPGTLKKQDVFVSKPPCVKEKIVHNGIIKEQEKIVPQEAPAVAQGNEAKPAIQEKVNEGSGGKKSVLAQSNGADKEYYIKQADEQGKVSAASVTKRPDDMTGPLLIKNNVIKPLSGRGMTVVYKVEDACNVLIRVYNRKGEPVKTLVQALQGNGIYTVDWDGEDKDNRVVGDGIYVVHVKTCLTEQKIKAMVVK